MVKIRGERGCRTTSGSKVLSLSFRNSEMVDDWERDVVGTSETVRCKQND